MQPQIGIRFPRSRWVLLLTGLLANAVFAQSPGNLGTTRLQEVASQYLERSAFAAAVPYLSELERRLRESDESAAVRARETILFYPGVGQLQSAELPLAASTLARFLSLYPDSVHAPTARLYRGDAFYYQGRAADAVATYEELLADEKLNTQSAADMARERLEALSIS